MLGKPGKGEGVSLITAAGPVTFKVSGDKASFDDLFLFVRKKTLEKKLLINLDFGEINTIIQKKGIRPIAVRCPNCGASMKPPESGSMMTCSYCNFVSKVEDVLDEMLDFLKKIGF